MPSPATLPPPLLQELLSRRRGVYTRSLQGAAPDPVRVPYHWLRTPLDWTLDRVYTAAETSGEGGTTGRAADAVAIDEFGESVFTATLANTSVGDLANLAHFTVVFFAPAPGGVPRSRMTAMVLSLNARTAAEQATILSVAVGTRISVTSVPPDWPSGATEQVVEGVSHAAGVSDRIVGWVTAPVVNTAAGVAVAWFRLGSSALGGNDYLPY